MTNAIGEDSDVLQHSLAAVTKARSLDSTYLQATTQAVDDEGSEGFAVDVLSDDEQRTTRLYGLLEDRKDLLQRRDLLVVDEDIGVLQLASIFSELVTK